MSEATIEIRDMEEGRVKIRLDRPGVAAVSWTGDVDELLDEIARVMDLTIERYARAEAEGDA